MSFDRYFNASSYALLTMSFVMLVATRQLDPAAIVLYAGVLVAGWLVDNGRLQVNLSQQLANYLMFGYLPVALIEWRVLDFNPVTVIVHFIFFASSLKLLRAKTSRDWLWLYIVSFCQVLMAAGMMAGTQFFLLLIIYLLAAISAFVSFEIRRSQQVFEANHAARNPAARPPSAEFWKERKDLRYPVAAPRWRSLSYFSSGVLALILLLSVPIFLAMPRLTRGFTRNGLLATETLSGFSDSVRLGEVAQVKLNPQIVMRVRVKSSAEVRNRQLRWRGVTLDYYDGRTWSESGQGPILIRRSGGSFQIDDKLSPHGFTQQRFFVEPLNINTVFVAPRPIHIIGLPEVARDSGDGLWTEPHPYHKIEYAVYSDTSQASDLDLVSDNGRVYPAEIKQRYLQLPLNHDRRIDELASEVTRGATTQLEMARRIEEHLRTKYNYSLSLQRVEEGDPVADFLFNVRSGHCEYFASAMVLMLRTRRVPARIVNGFQMGEYNDSADVYTVRQSDAHSWVEVYFPKSGWIAFDPTPPAGLSVYDTGVTAWLRHYGEAMEMFWLEHIVGFDTGKQISMAIAFQRWVASSQRDASIRWFDWVSNLARWVEGWREKSEGITQEVDQKLFPVNQSTPLWRRIVEHPVTLSLIGLSSLALAILAWLRYDRSWKRQARRDAANSSVVLYLEMMRLLEKAGHRRRPDQTPAEFALKLANPAVTEITNLYHRLRFGHDRLTDDEISRLGLLLGELKKSPGRNGK